MSAHPVMPISSEHVRLTNSKTAPLAPNLNVGYMTRSELAKFIPFETPSQLDINCTLNIEIGGDGGDNSPPGSGFGSTFELAKFLPSAVPHLLGKHHNCNRKINNDKGGDDDQCDGDEDDESGPHW